MSITTRATWRSTRAAAVILIMFTVLFGIVYPALITGVSQLAFPAPANGTLVKDTEGDVVGSSLIGQPFTDADGAALPQYFQSRPSAAFVDDHGYLVSSGSNHGPENEDLIAAITSRQDEIAARDGVDRSAIPADAVTASSSGLDPHISPEYARLQAARVAAERGLSEKDVADLVEAHVQGRDLGFLGDPRVNVLELNLALDALAR